MAGKPSQLPPVERLRHLFSYDPQTGIVSRNHGRGGELAGARVGTKNSHGHLICRVDYRTCYVHRIAWALYHGEEPPELIDHINGDGVDNRIANLRAATNSENRVNARPNTGSHSGLRGAHWSKSEGRWRSSIRVNGRYVHLGWFETKEDAAEAYAIAAERYFGEFSYYNRAVG
jgi:hypothetical protein